MKILQFLRTLAAGAGRATAQPETACEAGGIPLYDTAKLRQLSPCTDTLAPVGAAHAQAWVGYWKRKGFLNL